jgi:hypothetical protein
MRIQEIENLTFGHLKKVREEGRKEERRRHTVYM